ncbi:CNT_collapsed_G0029610.mRNA.1.CDS.1 [Saccharomyces cerevisiae]|nr:CNT_collapsed_G0029610.mRNA.1.CDS.1 [Saccharomyces cerevisiae]
MSEPEVRFKVWLSSHTSPIQDDLRIFEKITEIIVTSVVDAELFCCCSRDLKLEGSESSPNTGSTEQTYNPAGSRTKGLPEPISPGTKKETLSRPVQFQPYSARSSRYRSIS